MSLITLLSFLRRYILPFGTGIALAGLVDILTNGIVKEILFDSKTYIEMAEHGFAHERVSPFIYRFAGPFFAGGIHRIMDLSIYKSFKVITYLGAISELVGVFLLVRYLTKSEKSAYIGMLVVAFSMYNLKYPLFDVYRPDILAYPIILIGTWLAFNNYFLPLLLATMIGLQFREFAIVPLLAYLAVNVQHAGGKAALGKAAVAVTGLLLAIGLPRLLIPVEGHMEAVELSWEGIGQVLYLISLWPRNINIVYIVLAYFLPFLVLYSRPQMKAALRELSKEQVNYLAYYSCAVFLLLFIGGTDLYRFATYFFLPLAVFTGLLAKDQPFIKILLVLTIQILFNRIWLPFPTANLDLTSFYSGWYDVINTASLWRFAELIGLAVLGNFLVHFQFSPKQKDFSESEKRVL